MANKLTMGVKEREQLYRLMISQLFYDGYPQLAVQLAKATSAHPSCPPSDRLMKVFSLGLKIEEADKDKGQSALLKGSNAVPATGIDLEFETDVQTLSPEAAQYETCYVTAHKGPCRSAAFHPAGSIIATGSEDASIKILDVDRMLAKSTIPQDIMLQESPQQQMENHPVIRTLYDHTNEVTCLEFHPIHQILASGGRDFSVKFFEYSKPSVKKAYKSIQCTARQGDILTMMEASEVRCISFHPSGDFILVGTQHPTLRLYDVKTFQCFVASNPNDQHTGPITSVKYNPNANMYVSASKDGNIKLWDGVSNKCINTFVGAHDGTEVCSVVFSRNSKYVLSSGKDSIVKLWELSTSRCLIAYTGAGSGKQEHRTVALFNHTEDYVFYPDEKTTSLCCWDSRNADRQRLLSLGHNGVVRCIAHSPIGPSFVSCSDDFRARFWYRRADTD